MKIIFNTSMPRSGSELFQVIVHQNPSIYASPTSPLLEYQFAARGNYNLPEVKSQNPQLMQNAFLSMCASMAEGYYKAITNRPIILDKNRGWSHYYEWVEQWNPNPKMICLVRDLRSILCSFERIFRENRFSPDGPDSPAQLKNMTVTERFDYWLNTQPIGLALKRTQDSFQRKIDKNILFIKYEDLCNNPSKTMNIFYNYLEMEPFNHKFDNLEKMVYEDDSHYGIFGNHKVKDKITPCKEKDWTDIIPKRLEEMIVSQYGWYFNKFNYEVE